MARIACGRYLPSDFLSRPARACRVMDRIGAAHQVPACVRDRACGERRRDRRQLATLAKAPPKTCAAADST